MKHVLLHGAWTVEVEGLSPQPVQIPGTLDESGIGFPDEGSNQWHPENELGNASEFAGKKRILTRLTRKVTYEGPAVYRRTFSKEALMGSDPTGASGKRVFLEVERSRELTLALNGQAVPPAIQGTVSTPFVFELTSFLKAGENEIALTCDNSYPTWPHDAIVFSSAATDETQTNWNGLLGYVRLRVEASRFVSAIRVYPAEKHADVLVEMDCATPYAGEIRLHSPAFRQDRTKRVELPAGRHEIWFSHNQLSAKAKRWDEGEGYLHPITAEGEGVEPASARFGLRTFAVRGGRLALNGRHFFLRSEANCCVFPATGHMPMDIDAWKTILSTYAGYGVNSMRFHSHCPPEAAFAAADEMGMLMQPELSHWNPRTAFEDERSWAYYPLEMRQILRAYANHPSFVMMTWGNELQAGELGHQRMTQMLHEARVIDPTRLYAQGSNNHLGRRGADPASDFYTGAGVSGVQMRATSANMKGYLNEAYPTTATHFDGVVAKLREDYQGAVYSFEVGQYEVLPDFDEWVGHEGITRPDNYDHIRERVTEIGWMPDWKRRVAATGELSLLGYKEEVEAVLRSETLSGISLLGLQDFPGQGTALVGMLNAHLQPKPFPFAQPERFREVFSDVVPLVLLPKYTYVGGEALQAEVKLANYGKTPLTVRGVARLVGSDPTTGSDPVNPVNLSEQAVPVGTLTSLGVLQMSLPAVGTAQRFNLEIVVEGRDTNPPEKAVEPSPEVFTRHYPVWVYPNRDVAYPSEVLVTQSEPEAREALAAGRKVLYTPPATAEAFPQSIRARFTTDFWSVGTFAAQEGFMGVLVEPEHPVFAGFPTEFHSNWQWWPMSQGRAMILPLETKTLVTALDCYARMRHMGMLVEGRVGEGKLMVSSMGLLENRMYPEARAMLQSILDYMASDAFQPTQMFPEIADERCHVQYPADGKIVPDIHKGLIVSLPG